MVKFIQTSYSSVLNHASSLIHYFQSLSCASKLDEGDTSGTSAVTDTSVGTAVSGSKSSNVCDSKSDSLSGNPDTEVSSESKPPMLFARSVSLDTGKLLRSCHEDSAEFGLPSLSVSATTSEYLLLSGVSTCTYLFYACM